MTAVVQYDPAEKSRMCSDNNLVIDSTSEVIRTCIRLVKFG